MPDTSSRALALQRAFALHLRDPDRHPAPDGLEDRRVQIYRDLFFANVRSLLAGSFPVLRSLYDDDGWDRLVRRWFGEHRAQTPLFPALGQEFVDWLHQCAGDGEPVPAWQVELAHYEWAEVIATNSEHDLAAGPLAIDGDLLNGIPVLSPLVWPLCYLWPVHRIRADARPDDQPPVQPTCLIVVRDRDDRVGFLEANPLTLRLIERLREHADQTGRALLHGLAADAGMDANRLVEPGLALLQQLRTRDIVLGIRPD